MVQRIEQRGEKPFSGQNLSVLRRFPSAERNRTQKHLADERGSFAKNEPKRSFL